MLIMIINKLKNDEFRFSGNIYRKFEKNLNLIHVYRA